MATKEHYWAGTTAYVSFAPQRTWDSSYEWLAVPLNARHIISNGEQVRKDCGNTGQTGLGLSHGRSNSVNLCATSTRTHQEYTKSNDDESVSKQNNPVTHRCVDTESNVDDVCTPGGRRSKHRISEYPRKHEMKRSKEEVEGYWISPMYACSAGYVKTET